LKT
jgi:hypothetical protein